MRTTVRGLRRLINEKIDLPKGEFTETGYDSDLENDIFDMITTAYAPVGGNAKISKPTDVGKEYETWLVGNFDDDPEPDAVVLGNTHQVKGKKLGASATDGTTKSKQELMQLKSMLLKNGWWCEVSDAPAHIVMNKLGISPIEDEQKVRALLKGKEIEWHGEHPEGKFPGTLGWYTRTIGSAPHTKIIVGDV